MEDGLLGVGAGAGVEPPPEVPPPEGVVPPPDGVDGFLSLSESEPEDLLESELAVLFLKGLKSLAVGP